ncbi:MAG: glycerate kinase [Candidatus Abyssubacteria bacterium]
MSLRQMREAAESIAWAAIRAVNPENLVRNSVKLHDSRLDIDKCSLNLDEFSRIIVIGAGKASASMAKALEDILGDRIEGGIIIVKDGHSLPLKRLEVVEAGHPIPDERGVRAARAILSLVTQNSRPDTLIFCLISGGGSALMPLPTEGVSLADKQHVTKLLLDCGATIEEINAVRKHISRIKGGQLARAASPSRLVSLILSDVVGDPLDVIASGPTVGDSSTFEQAKAVLDKYEIWRLVPNSVSDAIEAGLNRKTEETPKPNCAIFHKVTNIIIGNNRTALNAAFEHASKLGFHPLILTTYLTGEAREIGTVLASIALEVKVSSQPVSPPACILAGGETTVTIRGDGTGGRNQEVALAAALRLAQAPDIFANIVAASIGTDGTDGPTDAAGAIIDHATVPRARQMGLEPIQYLRRNDTYNLFKQTGELLITGPTGTNVMDVLIVLIT